MDPNNSLVRRLTSILLLICFSAFGSGLLSHLHAQDHATQDLASATHAEDAPHQHSPAPRPTHDENNCDLHALLRAPLASFTWAPILVVAGGSVETLSLSSDSLVEQHTLARIDCRGPPSF